MRLSTYSYLALPALVLASPPVAPAHQQQDMRRRELAGSYPALPPFNAATQTEQNQNTALPTASPTPTQVGVDEENQLELRQVAGNDNLGTTLAATSESGFVTSQWLESTIDGTTTWLDVVYTQSFASIPDQWSTAGSGSIGLGTITGTVGIVNTEKKSSGAMSVMPSGTFFTIAMGAVGFVAGMGMIVL